VFGVVGFADESKLLYVAMTRATENLELTCDRLSSREQKSLDKVLLALEKQRDKAFDKVKATFDSPSYQHLKTAGDCWVQKPQFTALERLPLCLYLPDLIIPLLSAFLMHSGWLIPANFSSEADDIALHDLRKICKYIRYQAELFAEFYDKAFHDWIDEVKLLQDRLGKVHDIYILLKLILKELPQGANLPELQQAIQADRLKALENWESLRQKYLDPNFRYHQYQMILEPLKQQLKL